MESDIKRKWVLHPRVDPTAYPLQEHPVFLQILANRKQLAAAVMQGDTAHFFHPDYDTDLADPLLMPNMDRAVDRVAKALKGKEKIALFCDYDADGVTSATVLTHFLREFAQVEDVPVHLPDRVTEGYGLNKPTLKRFAEEGVTLVITADLGVSNTPEIDYANELGVDVVVLDHHLPPPDLDPKYIIVDPKIPGHSYPFAEYCAAAMSFTFVRAMIKKHRDVLPGYADGQEKWLLDVVSIGTVADCMPLVGENRVLVTYGLKVIAKTKRIGLKAMMEKANLTKDKLQAGSIGFILGPRINAAGRIKHANTAYELLTSTDEETVERLAEEVEKTNAERRDMTMAISEEAMEQIGDPGDQRVLFAASDNWSQGVVGIVAGRVTERFARPTFILSIREDGTVTGSARSIKGFDVVEAIRSQKELLTTFGGHKMAAGCSMLVENLEKFKEGIERYAREQLKESDLRKTLEIDMELPLSHVDWDVVDLVMKLEPTGIANPRPIFLSRGVEVAEIRTVGQGGDHLKLRLHAEACDGHGLCVGVQRDAELDPHMPVQCRASSCLMESIGFGLGNHAGDIVQGDKVDVVYEVDVNEWNGTRSIQLKIVDLQKAGAHVEEEVSEEAGGFE